MAHTQSIPEQTLITVNGKRVTIPEARRQLKIPNGACFGCYLGDSAPETHDRCVVASHDSSEIDPMDCPEYVELVSRVMKRIYG